MGHIGGVLLRSSFVQMPHCYGGTFVLIVSWAFCAGRLCQQWFAMRQAVEIAPVVMTVRVLISFADARANSARIRPDQPAQSAHYRSPSRALRYSSSRTPRIAEPRSTCRASIPRAWCHGGLPPRSGDDTFHPRKPQRGRIRACMQELALSRNVPRHSAGTPGSCSQHADMR